MVRQSLHCHHPKRDNDRTARQRVGIFRIETVDLKAKILYWIGYLVRRICITRPHLHVFRLCNKWIDRVFVPAEWTVEPKLDLRNFVDDTNWLRTAQNNNGWGREIGNDLWMNRHCLLWTINLSSILMMKNTIGSSTICNQNHFRETCVPVFPRNDYNTSLYSCISNAMNRFK